VTLGSPPLPLFQSRPRSGGGGARYQPCSVPCPPLPLPGLSSALCSAPPQLCPALATPPALCPPLSCPALPSPLPLPLPSPASPPALCPPLPPHALPCPALLLTVDPHSASQPSEPRHSPSRSQRWFFFCLGTWYAKKTRKSKLGFPSWGFLNGKHNLGFPCLNCVSQCRCCHLVTTPVTVTSYSDRCGIHRNGNLMLSPVVERNETG